MINFTSINLNSPAKPNFPGNAQFPPRGTHGMNFPLLKIISLNVIYKQADRKYHYQCLSEENEFANYWTDMVTVKLPIRLLMVNIYFCVRYLNLTRRNCPHNKIIQFNKIKIGGLAYPPSKAPRGITASRPIRKSRFLF